MFWFIFVQLIMSIAFYLENDYYTKTESIFNEKKDYNLEIAWILLYFVMVFIILTLANASYHNFLITKFI